jgi:acetate kinase
MPIAPVDVLTVNAGSSSLKLRLVDADGTLAAQADLAAGEVDGLERFLESAPRPSAAAHRFVHGGPRDEAAVLDARVLEEIEAAAELAPLHTPPALACVRQLTRLRPQLPQVACFDTAFHRTLPEATATYAIPAEWRHRHGIRRRGFHGLSHAWASRRTAELLDREVEELRVVTCHIGAGVSLAAVAGGRSLDTTMGMTPTEGPVMATRSGTVDPGALLLLVEREGGAGPVRDVLERRSGLLGLSGVSGDVRSVFEAADAGHRDAQLAIDVYVRRLQGAAAAMAASMGGLDALAFTGGVGENSHRIRAAVCERLGFLGVELDPEAGERCTHDAVIGAAGSTTQVVVVRAREDLEMAREARRVLDRLR